MMDRLLSEDVRRFLNLIICYGAWLGSLTMAWWVIDSNHRRYGVIVVFLIGVAVTASLVRSRYKLVDSITEAFQAGLRIGRSRQTPSVPPQHLPVDPKN